MHILHYLSSQVCVKQHRPDNRKKLQKLNIKSTSLADRTNGTLQNTAVYQRMNFTKNEKNCT